MKAKHTPGPWGVGGSLVYGPNDTSICMVLRRPAVYGWRVCHTKDTDGYAREAGREVDANARLIAAAPDLLAECERALLYVLLHEPNEKDRAEARDGLRAAIAKARGEV